MSSYRERAPAPVRASQQEQHPHDEYLSEEEANNGYHHGGAILDGDEALLDLAQLEELHNEAEKMKALGNKHMATQEYTRAYNAYSAALQLSPVGPSSHVFLSNRAAALLSLKRYNAAATDARRAIALAPTFGKAHARLGQALYFIKDYEGAVSAYQDAMDYEPDNQVTLTYLEKAKVKLDKQRRKLRGEDGGSVAPSMAGDASHMHYAPSVVTDDPRTNQHTLMHGNYRGSGAAALMKAAAARKQTSPSLSAASSTPSSYYLGSPQSPAALKNNSLLNQSLDPDFDEALRIQQVANKFLANKQYKAAIEEYTAALFLVPDDVNLSHELHLGRAHALNGSRRHERARNDALLANKLKVSPAAYSTLAKSYFYMKDYHACIEAFDECIKLLPAGETLGLFDRAYLEKAEAALEEDEASLNTSSWSKKSVVPKLPPPRFVARDEAIQSTPTLPSMPKEWPQQSPRDPKVFRCGVEREIVFLSEQLGIKLNRGSDGIVRVLSVTPSTPGSPLMRQGEIHLGDVIRECAGVDLRRPITNIMWGDTVALVKMAPRPISFLVARELSEIPPAVVEELQKAEGRGNMSSNGSVFSMFTSSTRPSNSNGDEPVRSPLPNPTDEPEPADHFLVREEEDGDGVDDNIFCEEVKSESDQEVVVDDKGAEVIIETLDGLDTTPPPPSLVASESLQLRGMEDRLIGGEILFERVSKPAYFNWDNLRWLSYSGARKVAFCQMGYRYFASQEKKLMFWSATTTDTCYEARSLVIYNEPSLILILRRPKSEAEVVELLGLDDLSELDEPDSCLETHWVVESVVEPSTCTLRLSPLTNVCSIPPTDADERRLSCLELRTPVESILFSSVRVRETVKPAERSFGDSGAFLEASATEAALMKKICSSHDQRKELGLMGADLSWKHQVILGTLHSLVVSGSAKLLDTALQNAMIRAQADTDGFADVSRLPSRVIDEPDESGLTPLYYAVMKKMSDAVALLIKAGASSDFRDAHNGMTLAHLAARNGDEKSLATILECNAPRPNPNALDATGRTPMYVACVEGQESTSLRKCITVLAAWGGKLTIPDSLVPLLSPVHYLASIWRAEPLAVVLEHTGYRYPLRSLASSEDEHVSASVGALFQYPLHAAIAALSLDATGSSGELLGTLRVLVERGFEVNERMDRMSSTPAVFKDLVGFTPLQILTVASIRLTESAESVDALALTRIRKLIEDVAIFLVRNGARISMDPPPVCRPRRILSVVVEATDNRHIRNCITWTSKEMVKALGDDVTFKQAAQEWHDSKTVKANDSFDLLENDEEVFPDNDAGGGSDEKSCAVCWKQFGAVMNWKHRCRVTRRFVCDECSSKRLVRGTKQYRACDGQYRLARFDAANEYQQAVSSYNSRSAPAQQSGEDQVATRLERLAASEQSERDSLFGNMLGQATGLIFGSEIQDDVEPDSLGGLSSALSGARDALNQRGDKLNQLGDKSADLVNASESFAKMAKELAKKSEQGFFW